MSVTNQYTSTLLVVLFVQTTKLYTYPIALWKFLPIEQWEFSAFDKFPLDVLKSVFSQYLGSTRVTKTHGPGSTDDAVKKIVNDVSFLCLSIHLSVCLSVCLSVYNPSLSSLTVNNIIV